MHVRNIDMPRIIAAGLIGTALAVILVISTLSPKQVSAQTASPNPTESSAAPAKPVSVLDRIRKKMRDSNTPQDRARKWFDSLDADRNSEISKQELFQNIRQRFNKIDESGDNFVSKSEYLGLRKAKRNGERRFGELDSNADGKLSMSEFASPADWRFDRIDRNLDGKVSKQEAARLFDRPLGESLPDEDGVCFYVERQVVRVKKEVAETFSKRGYPKADCSWKPEGTDEAKTKKFLK
jgi:Ca2+-binding EF-hand superfamily protein